jgi:hypothetical protein
LKETAATGRFGTADACQLKKAETGGFFPTPAAPNHRKSDKKLQMCRDNDRFLPKSP